MADGTAIEWTDMTWNPIVGCTVVSPGCTNCYAMKLAGGRLKDHPTRTGLTTPGKAGPVWNGTLRFNEAALPRPMRLGRPRMIFVCAHGDLFHESAPDAWIDRVFAIIARSPHHVFQVLTKRDKRMHDYMTDPATPERIARAMDEFRTRRDMLHAPTPVWPLPNVWLGVSVETQRYATRVFTLLNTPAAVRWVSAEPLLGPLDLTRIHPPYRGAVLDAMTGLVSSTTGVTEAGGRLDWVVAGGESQAGARPPHPEWFRSLRDQCAEAGVAFLFKQWGDWEPVRTPFSTVPVLLKDGKQAVSVTSGFASDRFTPNRGDAVVSRAGKKAAGRHLDGVLHDGYPKAAAR